MGMPHRLLSLFLPLLMPLPMSIAGFHLHVLTGEVWLLPKELCGTIYLILGLCQLELHQASNYTHR